LLAGARPTADNAFKATLAQRTIAAVMAQAQAKKG
ncbi:MAG: xanthine dehydrogenase family protein subunit M, partial [Janthinobacterium sp.]